MKNLGIVRVFQGQQNKLAAFETLCRDLNLTPDQVAHVGDDLLDLPIMSRAGLSIAVADAHFAILPYAHWRTSNPGGAGAAREVCDLIMEAQGSLKRVIESHL
jgi:3-deoxy-D-manno-octulosonate 8-phosphate phosphatase (KDO 8-P phosphatase)